MVPRSPNKRTHAKVAGRNLVFDLHFGILPLNLWCSALLNYWTVASATNTLSLLHYIFTDHSPPQHDDSSPFSQAFYTQHQEAILKKIKQNFHHRWSHHRKLAYTEWLLLQSSIRWSGSSCWSSAAASRSNISAMASTSPVSRIAAEELSDGWSLVDPARSSVS